jgi:hypothetical protein
MYQSLVAAAKKVPDPLDPKISVYDTWLPFLVALSANK